MHLGNFYLDVMGNEKEGEQWIRRAAEQGLPGAQWELGEMYFRGQGVPKDKTEEWKWLFKAGEHAAWAQSNIANMYMLSDGPLDEKEINKCLKPGTWTQYCELGPVYVEAAKWYRKAADQGYAEAQDQLGQMYAAGEGVKQDYTEAIKWFRKAANQENPWAQLSIAALYAQGRGVKQDWEEACFWLFALRRNSPNTQHDKEYPSHLTPKQVIAVEKRVKAWKPTRRLAVPPDACVGCLPGHPNM